MRIGRLIVPALAAIVITAGSVSAAAPTPPPLDPSPNRLNFGRVAVGSSVQEVITFTNVSGEPVAVSPSSSGFLLAFSLVNPGSTCVDWSTPIPGTSPVTVLAGASCTATVRFAPATAGRFSGYIGFGNNADGFALVTLVGRGY
jgi:hypothetical protein